MAKNKTILWVIIGIAAIVVAYAVLLSPILNFQRTAIEPEKATQKEVACNVIVSNPRGIPLIKNGDLVIESASCKQQYVSTCARFGLFTDKGSLRLDADGGIGSATDVSISEGSQKDFSLNWCGSKLTNKFKIKLFDSNNNLLQLKEVTLQ